MTIGLLAVASAALGLALAGCGADDGEARGATQPGADAGAALNGQDLVGRDGVPDVPDDYRGPDWIQLGTWAVAPGEGKPVHEQHLVYAQRAAVAGYERDAIWPDGTTLVKELRSASGSTMSTGFSAPAGELNGWFVMVKHAREPVAETPHWGNGWYGAQYAADAPRENVSPGWTSCRGCHLPVRSTDWVFVDGYPLLER